MAGNARYSFEPLSAHHNRDAFSCGVEPLDRYLKQQAGQDVRRHIAAVWILYDAELQRIVGYYTLSATGVEPTKVPDDMVRRLPRYDLLPAALLGRLAVDHDYRGQGFGEQLLLDALHRAFAQREQIAAMAVVVDAKDDAAVSFYARYGFEPLLDQSNRLVLSMRKIAQIV